MKAERAAEELKVIRQLMERPIRVSTMSGLSGIVAGLAAVAGVALDQYFWGRFEPQTAVLVNLAVWIGVLVAAGGGVLVLTRLRERRRGMPGWSRIKTRILLTILPAFVAGAGLTAAITGRYYVTGTWDAIAQGYLIPAIWMLFYGVALWQLGEFSPGEVRLLGAAFILAGVAAGLYPYLPYVTLGLTFGGFHFVYGIVVWIRHGG